MSAMELLVAAHPLWAWLAVGAVFLVVEVITGSGWLLWPAGSAALTGLTTVVWPQMGLAAEVALFAMATIVSTYLGRRIMRTRTGAPLDINDPLGRLIGHRGEATARFEAGVGRVFVDGKEWPAEVEGGGVLEKGAKVEVIQLLGGARLRGRGVRRSLLP